MGVTFGRLVIKGGKVWEAKDTYSNLGLPLTEYIDTFVGISGANYGIYWCAYDTTSPFCSNDNGYGTNPSSVLQMVNNDNTREGKYVFSLYSTADDIVGDLVGT